MNLLGGDLGGTKTLLALARAEADGIEILHEARYESAAYDGLAPMVRAFLAAHPELPVTHACFGVAGPVRAGPEGAQARITNLPWVLEERALAGALGLRAVRLINDFQAAGYGLEALGEADLHRLQAGAPVAHAPRALIGAGTGLGHATLIWDGAGYEVYPSEAGHSDFGPVGADQVALLEHLRGELGRVSWEHVVSGPGLTRLYGYCAHRRGAPAPALEAEDPAAAVSAAAADGTDPAAVEALDLFVRCYGQQAGNFALAVLPRAGLFVGGGIAPRILPVLADGRFLTAFRDKPPMQDLLAEIPVAVVTNPRLGLLGALVAARRLAQA